MGTEGKRKITLIRMQQQIAIAHEQGKGISKEKMIAEICIELGITRRKAAEYVQLLIDAERIIESEGHLWIKVEDGKAEEH